MLLDFLRPLYQDPPGGFGGRYVSVYLDTTPTTAKAEAQVTLRWQAARKRLAEAGADEATLDAVDRTATVLDHEVRGRVIFARDGATWLEGTLPWPPRQELANLAPLPHVMPWLAQLPARAPHVRVAATREGGHVLAVTADGAEADETTVEGITWPVHKVSSGGWSQQRLQRSAEETWAANAKRTVAVVVAEAERVHAEFVLVGGDVRERSMVLDLLPPALREAAVIVDKEVAADDAEFDAAAEAEEKRMAARAGRQLLGELAVRLEGSNSGTGADERRAVTGLSGTFTALRDGLASDVLLIGEPAWLREAVWIGPGLAEAAVERAALADRGVTDLLHGRADAALARAAAGTDAQLHLLFADHDDDNGETEGDPRAAEVTDGVAALLRAPAAAL
jgi:hypothetical protein